MEVIFDGVADHPSGVVSGTKLPRTNGGSGLCSLAIEEFNKFMTYLVTNFFH